jgi:hypothetical protein
MATMIVLLMALTFATAASVAVTQEHPDVAPALAAIEFAGVPSDVSLLVEAGSTPPEALNGVAEALGASVVALDSVVTCPAEAPIDPCRIAPGVAVVAFRSLEPEGESPRFGVTLHEHDPVRDILHISVVGVELGYGSEGWEVTEVLFRAAN